MDEKDLLKYIHLFRGKSNAKKLIIFVGAGVSCNVANMPDWNNLINEMAKVIKFSRCDTCKKKEKGCDKTCKLKEVYSNDEFLKIPQYVFNKNQKKYYKVLEANIKHSPNIDAPISNAILDLAPAHVITTNYDKLLENCKSVQKDNYDVIVYDKDLLNTKSNSYIIKMHGDISDAKTIVLKESDYLEYSQNHVLIEMFVRSLLTDHTILFLGYSLNDYNIKLIISWINYIRSQNNSFDKDVKFGYIVLDDKKINKNQKKYFEKNNIGVVNLYNMPLIEDNRISNIPYDKGKRLYSFLRTIAEPSFDKKFDAIFSYDEAVMKLRKYKYISAENICRILNVSRFSVSKYTINIFDEEQYDKLITFINSENPLAIELKQAFSNANIEKIDLVASQSKRWFEGYNLTDVHNDLLDNKLYQLYLENNYQELKTVLNQNDIDVFSFCFYNSLINGYIKDIFEKIKDIDEKTLYLPDKVRYLFNKAILDSRRTLIFDGNYLRKYIDNIADLQQQKCMTEYKKILEGNYKLLFDIKEELSKLKDIYTDGHNIIGGGSLGHFYNIQFLALNQYNFYFRNNLFFKGFTDLNKILQVYIEAILCTNGKFKDSITTSFGESKKDRYEINIVDVDIITKFCKIKDLYNLIQEYSVESLNVSSKRVDDIIGCFENLSKELHACITEELVGIFINYVLLFTLIRLTNEQENRIIKQLLYLMKNEDFVKCFYSSKCFHFSTNIKILAMFLRDKKISANFNIIKNIISNTDFVNINIYDLRKIIGALLPKDLYTVQKNINEFLLTVPQDKTIDVLHLIFVFIKDEKYKDFWGRYIQSNFEKLDNEKLINFAFADWIELNDNQQEKVILKVANEYEKRQKDGVRVYPDPLSSQLQTVYLLYISGKIKSLEKLSPIAKNYPFIEFFLDDENFDYSKIDFSNYMWQNIVRVPRFLDKIILHKEEVVDALKKKIEMETATEFEKKLYYGYFINKEEILK